MKRDGNSLHFTPKEAEQASMSIADACCFLDGMQFQRNDNLPWQLHDMREFLRELNINLKEMNWKKAAE